MKVNALAICSVEELPESINQALESQGITAFGDLVGKDAKGLQAALEPTLFKPTTNAKQELAQKMQKELLAAWLRFLIAKANGQLQGRTWRQCIDASRLGGQTAKDMLEAETMLRSLHPRQLIKQRSALKKVQTPKSRRIDHQQLKQARSGLVKIPKGEALAKTVSSELLSTAKNTLRQVKK